MCGAFLGSLVEGAGRDLIITVGAIYQLLMVDRLIKTPEYGTHWYEISNSPPPPEPPKNRPTHSCITDPKVQSQPEDGPHIGPKHVVINLL